MKKSNYSEKLRDPRWQKKRLEVMQRDNFTCQICGDTKTTLNVHHAIYTIGYEPWDYDIRTLSTLCEPCHEIETISIQESLLDLSNFLQMLFPSKEIDLIKESFRGFYQKFKTGGIS